MYRRYNLKESRIEWDTRGKVEYETDRKVYATDIDLWPFWNMLSFKVKDYYRALAQRKALIMSRIKRKK